MSDKLESFEKLAAHMNKPYEVVHLYQPGPRMDGTLVVRLEGAPKTRGRYHIDGAWLSTCFKEGYTWVGEVNVSELEIRDERIYLKRKI